MQYPVFWTLVLGLNQDTILPWLCENEAEGGQGSKREVIIT